MDGRQIINRKRLEETIGSYMLAWSALEADFPNSNILDLKGRPLPLDVCIQKKATMSFGYSEWDNADLVPFKDNPILGYYKDLSPELMGDLTNLLKEHRDHYVR